LRTTFVAALATVRTTLATIRIGFGIARATAWTTFVMMRMGFGKEMRGRLIRMRQQKSASAREPMESSAEPVGVFWTERSVTSANAALVARRSLRLVFIVFS